MEEATFEQRVADIKGLFREDLISEAKDAIESLEAELSPSQRASFLSTPEVALLKGDIALAMQSLELLSDLDSWELVNDTEEIATFYRGSGTEFFVRAEMIMNQPMFPALALFSEIDLLSSWITVLKRVEVVSDVTNYRKVLRYALDIPWPASDRYILVSAVGIAIRQNKSAMIVFKDVEGDSYLGAPMPPPEPGTVRANVEIGCINIMMLSPEQTQVSFIVKCDPQVALIPHSLLNFAEKKVVFFLLQMIRQKCKEYPGSEYERRVSVRTDYYELLRSRLEKYTS